MIVREKEIKQAFKCLVDQTTGHVVWMSYYLNHDAPSFEPSLNHYRYMGNTDILVWPAYLTYELYLTNFGTKLECRAATPESKQHFGRIQLLRAKAIALDHCYALCNYHYDKQGHYKEYPYAKIRMDDLEPNMIAAHQQNYEFKSTEGEAIKLIKFKVDEYRHTELKLELFKIRFLNEIKSAKSLQEVADLYSIMTSKLFNINRTQLLSYQAIFGIIPDDDIQKYMEFSKNPDEENDG